MSSLHPTTTAHLKSRFTLLIAALTAIALLLLFMPRDTKFGYEYEAGRPWRYNSLIATFDFPIYKGPDEVKAERDSALRRFMPFYVKDEGVASQQVKALLADCEA